MPAQTNILERGKASGALPNPYWGANRHLRVSREGVEHDMMQLHCATSQLCPMWGCDNMLFKHYSVHSNEGLDRYFYYNPMDFIWMCHLTDTPACKAAAAEIKQQLEIEKDLNFWGILNDKIVYTKGHWVPLEGTNRREEEIYQWVSSTTHVDEGTKMCQNYKNEDCPPSPLHNNQPTLSKTTRNIWSCLWFWYGLLQSEPRKMTGGVSRRATQTMMGWHAQ